MTFLTSSNYRESAKNLDDIRLEKQCIESQQILILIENLSLLSRLFNIPIPNNPYLRRDWIRRVIIKYNNIGKYLFYHQGNWIWISRKTKPYKLKFNETAEIQKDGSILVFKKTKRTFTKTIYPKYTVILNNDRLITFEFVYHPAVLMWLCYNESLKEYINAHIQELSIRNIDTLHMNTYELDHNKNHKPIWVDDTEIHNNHKAILYIKEIKNNESAWYINKSDFVKSSNDYLNLYNDSNNLSSLLSDTYFDYYIWPFNKDDNRYKI